MSNIVLLVTGSRSILDKNAVWAKLDDLKTSLLPHKIVSLIHGDAIGVDKFCESWAIQNGISVQTRAVSASDWDKYGAAAGMVRNKQMLEDAITICDLEDALLHCFALWDGESKGTEHMINSIKKRGYHVEVHLMGKSKIKRLM